MTGNQVKRLVAILQKIQEIMDEKENVVIQLEAYEIVGKGTDDEAWEILNGWDITDMVGNK